MTRPADWSTDHCATYRFETQVPKHASNPKLLPTFTLPRSVEFR